MYLDPRNSGRLNKLVSRNREELYSKEFPESFYAELGGGWWVGVHMGAKDIRHKIELVCDVAGVKFGTQLNLIER